MHHALLIDEVLEVILDECLNWSHKERRYALRQLARCCKAWKDPALDRLWRRLDDAKPLLRLLPDCSMPQRGLYTYKDFYPDTDLATFLSYAARVKGITHRHFLGPLASSQSPGLILLPRLSSITLWFRGCDSDRCWMVSPALRHVEVNIGFVDDSATDVASRSDAVARYLDVAKSFAPDLQTLRLRGRMTDQLNSTVASMTHLTVLTVLTSDYLGMETLAAIATFPALRELNFHASRGCCDEFRDALVPLKGPYFPSLSLLRMRSPGPFAATLLELLPVGVLQSLHVDITHSPRGSIFMRTISEHISTKVSDSLQELWIDDPTHYNDLDDDMRLPGSLEWYCSDMLHPLLTLRRLRRFMLTTMFPPDLTDEDVKQMGKAWPLLEYLHLGAFDNELPHEWRMRITAGALLVVAKFFPRLEGFVLPMVLPSSLPAMANIGPTDDARISHLREFHLALGEACIPSEHLSMFIKYLLLIFPSSTLFNSDNSGANKCHHEFRLKLQDGADLETLEYHEDDAKLGLD